MPFGGNSAADPTAVATLPGGGVLAPLIRASNEGDAALCVCPCGHNPPGKRPGSRSSMLSQRIWQVYNFICFLEQKIEKVGRVSFSHVWS